MLELKNLETSYGQSQVLFGVDLQVNEQEVVTLLGRNGMGKTTTINSIMGIVEARSVEINFEGEEQYVLPDEHKNKGERGDAIGYQKIWTLPKVLIVNLKCSIIPPLSKSTIIGFVVTSNISLKV